ncbi:inactive phospholipase C-like protein 1 isoform X1 [Clavelina lepadiformis]|uniref:inactive phospholipase C-like protein 1 isoform X1 n=1 Tax=Clavelina lepadiformis TaxID=159417 RepID=UPI00404249FF
MEIQVERANVVVSSNIAAQDPDYPKKSGSNSDSGRSSTAEEDIEIGLINEVDLCNNLSLKADPSEVTCGGSCHGAGNGLALTEAVSCANNPCLLRKNKPPDLELKPTTPESEDSPPGVEKQPLTRESSTESDNQSPLQFITLRKRVTKSFGANELNSPFVKRASRLEQILEIPDVAAALVRDEGYDMMMRRRSHDNREVNKLLAGRQPTPGGKKLANDQFVFEPGSVDSPDVDLESTTTESDTSSIASSVLSNPTISPDIYKTAISHVGLVRAEARNGDRDVAEALKRISDCSVPTTVFNASLDRESPQLSPFKKGKKLKKSARVDVDEDGETTPTPRTRSFLARLKFTSGGSGRSSSTSSLDGWQSLTRALARVGVLSSASSDTDVNPPLTPILKKRTAPIWDREPPSSPKEPGTRGSLHKKTVSFSSLPSESCVKNASDCVSLMQAGHQFVKMRSNSRVYNRFYWLNENMSCLHWEPTKKDSGKARIDVTNIREIRPGKTTELFLTSDISTHFPDECSFSIIHWDGKTLDLIANSPDDANIWVTGLRCLMSSQDVEGLRMRSDHRDTWLSSMFDEADINKDGYLDEEESIKLLKSLHDGIRELRIKQKLQEHFLFKENDKSRLSRDEFIEIFKDVATRPEVYFLLARYATKNDQLSLDDLRLFLETEQGVCDVTNDDCVRIIEEFEPSEVTKAIPALGIDGFTKYLMSDNCSVFDPKHLKVCQDMTQPLSHYFIASSHNTYLMEDQVSGPSSVSAYVRALLRCCRCVELDCWDGPNGEPVVSHGHTPTNKIPFKQAIEAIKDSAFRASPYPVILTIENHCSESQQTAMTSYLKSVLGDKMYTEAINSDTHELPSPESLKHKFLIRARKLPLECTGDVGYVSEDDEGKEVNYKVCDPTNSPGTPPVDDPFSMIDQAEQKQPLVRELSDLVTICECVRLRDSFAIHRQTYSCQHTSSLHEKTAARLVETLPEEFVNHNKKYLTRVYPSGLRVDSSNFNPQDYWNCGVQIASLNYQTPGLMMDINDGKFSMNGGCGYVLKPAIMRDPMAYYSSQLRDSIPGVKPKLLHLRVISGQNFPKPRGGGAKGQVIDPYVLIEIFGVPADCAEQRTRTAPNNSGVSPIFDESFEFHLVVSSLGLVRFVVLDDDFIGDEFIGQYTIPFECLRPGYRHLRLRSIFDEPLENATLFVHIAISDAEGPSPGSAASTPNLTSNAAPRIPGKRGSTQKRQRKTRGRKDASSILQIRDVGRPAVDDLFRGATEHIQFAATLRDTWRWSLSYFRETCGVTPLASVKQCIRALGQRSRTDACAPEAVSRQKRKYSTPVEPELTKLDDNRSVAELKRRATSTDVLVTQLRRQPSDTSQSSTESSNTAPAHVSLLRHNNRFMLHLKGQCATNETWRKTALAFDALIADSLALRAKAKACCDALTAIYQKAVKLSADFPVILDNGSAPSKNDDVTSVTNGAPPLKKKSSKKKLSMSLDLERRKRQMSEENFRWNCSVIKGQRDVLMTSYTEVRKLMSDIWETGVEVGLAEQQEEKEVNGVESANENSNNNVKIMASQSNGNGVELTTFKRAVGQFTRPRSKSVPKLIKRSISDDDNFPVTSL